MLAELNPSAAARKTYAATNVSMSISSKVTISAELRAEFIAEGSTPAEIEHGLSLAPKYIEGTDPEKMLKTVRTAIRWAKSGAPKGGLPARPNDVRF